MIEYKVSLMRSFLVSVSAENETEAKHLAEYFIGYSNDSTPVEMKLYKFEISDIDMTMNQATDVEIQIAE